MLDIGLTRSAINSKIRNFRRDYYLAFIFNFFNFRDLGDLNTHIGYQKYISRPESKDYEPFHLTFWCLGIFEGGLSNFNHRVPKIHRCTAVRSGLNYSITSK